MARKRTSDEAQLPVCDPRSNSGKKESAGRHRSPYYEKWIHVIPLIVIVSFLILWWFYHPVDVVNEDGKIVSITPIPATNYTKVDRNSFRLIDRTELLVHYIPPSNGTAETPLMSEAEDITKLQVEV